MSRVNDSNDRLDARKDDAWLARPSIVVLAITVLLQLVIKVKGYFGVDGWLGFGALFGFLSCVAMVLVAKVLGWVLKRDEHFYAEAEDD